MRINAVGVTTTNMQRTVQFYTTLGFDFTGVNTEDEHVEPIAPKGSARLMIDTASMIEGLLGEKPRPGNCSSFAIEFDSPQGVNQAAARIAEAGFKIVKEPWDAPWKQRYAVVEDPDGYRVDLYAGV